jgi:hypothetical protein
MLSTTTTNSPHRTINSPGSPTTREDDPLKNIIGKKTSFKNLYNVIFFKSKEEYPSKVYLQRYIKFVKKNLNFYSEYFKEQRLQYLAIIEMTSRGNQCRLALLSDNIEASRLNIVIRESLSLYEDDSFEENNSVEEELLTLETDVCFTPSKTYSQVIACNDSINNSNGSTTNCTVDTDNTRLTIEMKADLSETHSSSPVTQLSLGTMTDEIAKSHEEKEQNNLVQTVFSLPPEAFIRACEKLGIEKLSTLIEKFSHAKQLLEL